MKKVLITGAAGFLGSHLTDYFLNRGDRVIGIDNLSTGNLDNLKEAKKSNNFVFYNMDVSKFIPDVYDLDYILHFASPASPPKYIKLPIETIEVNVQGTKNCLELSRKSGAKLLVASTSEIYGDPLVNPQPETYFGNVNTVGDRSLYDEAKRMMETYAHTYRKYFNVDARIIRIFNTYGPRMDPNDGRVVPAFILNALNGTPLQIQGDGKQTRSFCYVDDLIRGIVTVLETEDYDGPYNLGNPNEITIRDFATVVLRMINQTTVMDHSDADKHINYVPYITGNDPKVRKPDITKSKGLGWEPKVHLTEGLSKTIEYFKNI